MAAAGILVFAILWFFWVIHEQVREEKARLQKIEGEGEEEKIGLRDETGTSAFILAEYVDALVAGEEPDEEEFLHHAAPVDFEALKELFRVAREARGRILMRICAFLFPSIARKIIWRKIYCYLGS